MKYLILSLMFSISAHALKLERHQYPGYVIPAYRISTHCVIDSGFIKITKDFFHHGIQTSESIPFIFTDAERLEENINKAGKGRISESQGPVDGPSIQYLAFNNAGEEIILSSRNGGSGQIHINESQDAKELIYLIDNLCGVKPGYQ